MNDEDSRLWLFTLQTIFLKCMGQQHITHFESYAPVRDEVAHAFEKGQNDGPGKTPGINTKYLLYFGPDFRKCAWNNSVFNNMADLTPAKKDELKIDTDLNRANIIAWFKTFLVDAHASWNHKHLTVLPSGRYESRAEAVERAEAYTEQTTMAKLVTSRKHAKYLKQLTHLPELSVFDELNAKAMSSDYTNLEDPQHPLHTYIPHYWRRIIGDKMQLLDKAIIAKEMEGRKWKQGAAYCLHNLDRVLVSKRMTACEMPRCCYDKEFLSTLTPHDFVRLRLMEKKLEVFERYAEAQEVI
ncbi:hypothetical protein L218DRAFT_1001261 [Marasmius fiardii PR-910]|nr:hypothetical protein L218DRAFT_1001261 [Marasmius fiardii PR-910]